MINVKYILNKIKDVKLTDYLAIFPMIVALVVRPLFIHKYQRTWLVCEEKKEARDNGYWFFRKMRENHPEQDCIYAIDRNSVDYEKVKNLGEVIQYGSIKHWIVYFTCAYNISSQKGGKPNAALCAFIELNNFYDAHNVFLQHGVIINNLKWLYADCSKIDLFITSSMDERDFVEQKFGYPRGTVKLTGLSRWDNLHDYVIKRNRIVIMPTWRYWFNLKSKQKAEFDSDFGTSEYLLKWRQLLENKRFTRLINDYSLEVIFYPHRNMQRFLPGFKELINSKVIIASWEDFDLQELLKTSVMMITDYSSVFFDMIYMKKPVLFYQFDIDKFRKGQYEQGYFDYSNNPFGKSFKEASEVELEVENILHKDFAFGRVAEQAHNKIFPFYDSNNSERIYNAICSLSCREGSVNER